MLQADPRGIIALLAVAMGLALAVVLYRVGTRGSVARKLSLLLVVEAVTLGSSRSVEFLLVSPTATIEAYPRWYEIMFLVHTLGDCAMLALYPPFLAAALQTPMTRQFADKRVQAGLDVAAIALANRFTSTWCSFWTSAQTSGIASPSSTRSVTPFP